MELEAINLLTAHKKGSNRKWNTLWYVNIKRTSYSDLATGEGGDGEDGESARTRESFSANFSFKESIIARQFETLILDLQCERRKNHERKAYFFLFS